jgi:hypothetical protein
MVYSGAWGKLIHEKIRSQKSRGTVPLSVHIVAWILKLEISLTVARGKKFD